MARTRTSREEIIKAAAEIFCKKGFYRASIEEIAECAGIGKGTIYEYFSSKEELFFEMIRFNCENYFSSLIREVEKNSDFESKLRVFMDFHCNIVQRNAYAINIIRRSEGISLNSDMYKEVGCFLMQQRRRVVQLLEQIFIKGRKEGIIREVDTAFVANVFLDMIASCCGMIAILKLPQEKAEEKKKKLIDLLMFGIASNS